GPVHPRCISLSLFWRSYMRCRMPFRTASLACACLPLGTALGAADKKIMARGATIKGYSTGQAPSNEEGAHMRYALMVAALAGVAATSLQAQDGPYHFSKEISIGGEGGWDYLSVDPAAQRLYVSPATHL